MINMHCLGCDKLSEDRIFIDLSRCRSRQGMDILAR